MGNDIALLVFKVPERLIAQTYPHLERTAQAVANFITKAVIHASAFGTVDPEGEPLRNILCVPQIISCESKQSPNGTCFEIKLGLTMEDILFLQTASDQGGHKDFVEYILNDCLPRYMQHRLQFPSQPRAERITFPVVPTKGLRPH